MQENILKIAEWTKIFSKLNCIKDEELEQIQKVIILEIREKIKGNRSGLLTKVENLPKSLDCRRPARALG